MIADAAVSTAELANGAVTAQKMSTTGGVERAGADRDGLGARLAGGVLRLGRRHHGGHGRERALRRRTTGDVTLSVASGGITSGMLAANAVTSDKIADATVASADVAFNYAGSATKGGAASDLACTGCVVAAELSPTGGTSGKVLKHNGSSVAWAMTPSPCRSRGRPTSRPRRSMTLTNGGSGIGVRIAIRGNRLVRGAASPVCVGKSETSGA